MLLSGSPTSVHRAAIAHLLLVPLTVPPLQAFASEGGRLTGGLCRAALTLSNVSALLLLLFGGEPSLLLLNATPAPPSLGLPTAHLIAHALIALGLGMGCGQLLLMVHKGNVLRVMACTAAAVVVAALAIAAAFAPAVMARRFFQAAVLPFAMLFMEASGSFAPPSSDEETAPSSG